jgi:hypothetical protein
MPIFILLFMIAFTLAGLDFYENGKPGDSSIIFQRLSAAPQLDVYVSDQTATAFLSVSIPHDPQTNEPGPHGQSAQVWLTITVPPQDPDPVSYMLVSNTKGTLSAEGHRADGRRRVTGVHVYQSPRQSSTDDIVYGVLPHGKSLPKTKIARLDSPGTYASGGGQTEFRLPQLGLLDDADYPNLIVEGCKRGEGGVLVPAVVVARLDDSPMTCGSDEARRQQYYPPGALTMRDWRVFPSDSEQIEREDPSNGYADSNSISWETHTNPLTPDVVAVEPGEQDRRSTDTFIAGLLLAIAASGVIPFVQAAFERREPSTDVPPTKPPSGDPPGLPRQAGSRRD